MRSKKEYISKIVQLANYLHLDVYKLTLGYLDDRSLKKASYKELKLCWHFLQETCQSRIDLMEQGIEWIARSI